MTKVFCPLILTFLLLFSTGSPAQSFFDTLSEDQTSGSPQVDQDLATETIKKISDTKRIFIITNDNRSFTPGDFISLIVAGDLVVRALVAKSTEDGLAGIKILKIYSMKRWKLLREGSQVQVLRGDDSAYKDAKNQQKQSGDQARIQAEEDLYNETTFLEEENLTLEENNKREIKQDNVVALNYNSVNGIDASGEEVSYQQLALAWGYQLEDNFWGEFSFGQSVINDFPGPKAATTLRSIVLKAKYTFSTPLFSFTMPYIGYQIIDASSEQAGQGDGFTQEEKQNELALLEELSESGPVYGVTILKRLVPGWFIRGNLGTDQIGLGFALEF